MKRLARRTQPSNGVLQRLPRRDPVTFANAEKSQWLWRSYDDLLLDLQDWVPRLKGITAVCGVPRSGTIVASMLAALMNVPLLSLMSLQQNQDDWRPSVSKKLPVSSGRKILVVDDTVWSGGTLNEVKKHLSTDVLDSCVFGAVYVNAANTAAVDAYAFSVESIKHCFAWNFLRDIHSRNTLTDMDGVLCVDWKEDVNHTADASYMDFLANAAPLVKPIYPVLGIVTGRVGVHRDATIEWLRSHNMSFKNLIMPFETYDQRRGSCVGTAKAKVYDSHPEASLFVESNEVQAEVIFRKTGRPVLCTDTLEMIQ